MKFNGLRRCTWLCCLVLAPQFLQSGRAQEDAPPTKTFFLPKNPTAAAYVLNRLSNKELIAAPRSEFVYVALLKRKGLERKYRLEALEGLAKIRNTNPATELLRAIGELDAKGAESEPVLRDLAALLLQTAPAELVASQADLEKLATGSELPLTRQIARAAQITADGSANKVWTQAESDPSRLPDIIASIPLVRDAQIRAGLYSRIEPLLHKAASDELRVAAINSITAVPGHDTETFNTLASLIQAGTERSAAIASLQRIPRKSWPKERAQPLIDSLLAYLQKVPVENRTEPDVVNAFQLASDLSSLLPPDQGKTMSKALRSIGVSVFVVRTIPEQMLYDKTLIVVEAGKPVEIILVNDDAMPHNLAVITPGALEEIGQAAEKMQPEPDAQGRLYIPASSKVLHATKLIDPGQQAKLSFTAPEQPGDYQYVCTFPGHWRRMVGTLAVVKDVEAYLAARAAAPEPTMTEWKLEDLAPDLGKAAIGRNLQNGKEWFTKLACAQCHKLGEEGNNYGPNLSDVFKRYNNDRAQVLRQILEPSLVISNRYVNYQFEMKDGDTILGMILKDGGDTLTVQTGPSDALIQTIKKSDIKERQAQPSSPMPLGLLYTLSKEQIFDLLAYLESGGSTSAHEHSHKQ